MIKGLHEMSARCLFTTESQGCDIPVYVEGVITVTSPPPDKSVLLDILVHVTCLQDLIEGNLKQVHAVL